ncbi:hypothetical protein BGX27_005803 [Mortierella sp. AM989]|nr:hypothetical protein BGX27_005803 [Mortierella sp. AM989]
MQSQQTTKNSNVDHSTAATTTTPAPALTPSGKSTKSPAQTRDRQDRRRSVTKGSLVQSSNSSTATTEPTSASAPQAPAVDPRSSTVTDPAKRPNKKTGRSKKLVARRGPNRSTGEEAIELAVSSSDEDGDHAHARSGSESDDPDTDEEADLQIKKLALEKLSLERKDDLPPTSIKAPSRKQQQRNRGRTASQESQPSQPSNQNRDSAPASPTPSPSSPAPNSVPSSKKKRNKKAKQQDQRQHQSAVAGDKDSSQSQKNGADEDHRRQSSNPPTFATSSHSEQPTDPELSVSSKGNKRLSKQGAAPSSKQTSVSTAQTLSKDLFEIDSATADWGDSPMPEPTAVEKSPAGGQKIQNQPQQQSKSAAHLGRPVSRGRGGRAAAMARDEYRKKLAEDPSFVPHLGEFWGHDDRYRGAGLKNFSDRGGFRGHFMGRGGFGRGGMPQNPVRGEVRNEPPNNSTEKDPQFREVESKENVNVVKPRSDRWSHDGFDQLMKVQEKSYRHQRSDSRPRSMNAKPSGVPLSRTASNNPATSQSSTNSAVVSPATASTSTAEASKAGPTSNAASKSSDSTSSKSAPKSNDIPAEATEKEDKVAAQSHEESAQQAGSTSASTKAERPRSSAQFGEKDVKRASRLLHSALPKPAPKVTTAEPTPTTGNANGVDTTKSQDGAEGSIANNSTEKTDSATISPATQGAAANPKFRQPMPQSQPAAQHAGFRPQFIPGNFSSRGRGRGQSHPGHPMNFGHRGGYHHGNFRGHHPNHPHQSQRPPASSAAAATRSVSSKSGDAPDQPDLDSSKEHIDDHQEEKEQNESRKSDDVQENNAAAGTDTPISREATPPISSMSLKTAINAAPFKPSTPFAPADQPAELNAEEEYYGEEYGADDIYYYDPQQQQVAQPMYYYYYPPVPMSNGAPGPIPTSMPMGVPGPVPMGMPMGMPMAGQPYMAPMYYDGGVSIPGTVSPNGSTAAAPVPIPGPNGEMMMMMMAPEDYNNYYYYPPTMYYPPHPPAQHPDSPHHSQHQHPPAQTS